MTQIKTPMLIEQHIHGAFGFDYNKAGVDDVIQVSRGLYRHGIGGVFPTLVTDTVENIKRQIQIIKKASEQIGKESAKILGIHLEGIFINSQKKGIHDPELFKELTVNNYSDVDDDFIKIVTLAPELDKGLIDYLKDKNVKIQAGHCIGDDLSKVNGTTHTFNAMEGLSHKKRTTVSEALTNDNLYSEIIADGVHAQDDVLKIFLRSKPDNKVLLVSDALPISESNLKKTEFAGSKIYYDGVIATSKEGTIAGSTTLLDKIVNLLAQKNLMKEQYIKNPYIYHDIDYLGEIEWDNNWNILKVKS